MEGTDRETFTPCDMCKKHQQMGHVSLNTLCKGCRHNRTAIAWLRQQLATLQKTALVFTVDGLAPVEAMPTPTVRLKPSACPHTTARFSQSQGFICVDCGDAGLYKDDTTLYQALYTRVAREEA